MSSSESEDDIVEKAPPSKRIGVRLRATVVRKKPTRKVKTRFSTDEDTSEGFSEEENRRAISRRAVTATVSYKEDSEEKTDSEDLLEVENPPEPTEVKEEEKCECIEKVLAQRRGRKGGNLKLAFSFMICFLFFIPFQPQGTKQPFITLQKMAIQTKGSMRMI